MKNREKLCDRCQQADAVVTVALFTMDAGRTTTSERHLCSACAELQRTARYGRPPETEAVRGERFRPLHAHALRQLARLEATYEVTRSEAFPSLPGVLFPPEALMGALALPPVLLTPQLPDAAPLFVAFTTPPGLLVRCGRWHEAMFGAPFCRDDDVWTTSASEAARLDDLFGKVVDGLFAEAVRLPLVGRARLSATFGDGSPRTGLNGEGWMLISRPQARLLISSGPRAVRWRPWPPRQL